MKVDQDFVKSRREGLRKKRRIKKTWKGIWRLGRGRGKNKRTRKRKNSAHSRAE